MDAKLIEGVRCMNQIGAWETYGKDAVAVVSKGSPGNYDDNPTVMEYKDPSLPILTRRKNLLIDQYEKYLAGELKSKYD